MIISGEVKASDELVLELNKEDDLVWQVKQKK
jgi:hypothetical protein